MIISVIVGLLTAGTMLALKHAATGKFRRPASTMLARVPASAGEPRRRVAPVR